MTAIKSHGKPVEPTIAAIASPPGPGGIGVIRISGSNSLAILETIFSPSRPITSFSSHRLYYGWINDPEADRPIDEVLAVYMAAPHTYTREDVVEIQCHSSYLVMERILALVLRLDAVLADPGEFTKRAFLNGRIDLSQAEAVIELLDASTSQGLDMALVNLQGGLQQDVTAIQQVLVGMRAVVEVAIDFPDDDVEILDAAEMQEQLQGEVIDPLAGLIAVSDQGRIFRDGVSVVILGRPNVGKSSLLNALLREERAIVTAIPGTTRDTIEEVVNIKGMPVRIVDTAGIRNDAGEVEEIGIERARRKMAEADFIFYLVDGSVPLSPDDHLLYDAVRDKSVILVVNKVDVAPADSDEIAAVFPEDLPRVAISATRGDGLAELEQQFFDLVTQGQPWEPGHGSVPNVRQQASLERTLVDSRRLSDGLSHNVSADLLAVDLQAALDNLGDIVGETTTEDVLDMIFTRFCIGK